MISQGGILIALGNASVLTEEQTHMHPLFHQRTTLKRVVRATYQAETYQMQLGVEHADILRAGIADMYGKLDRDNWAASASKFCQNIWITDCKSTSTSLLRPVLGRIADKRLAIEVAAKP